MVGKTQAEPRGKAGHPHGGLQTPFGAVVITLLVVDLGQIIFPPLLSFLHVAIDRIPVHEIDHRYPTQNERAMIGTEKQRC